MNIVENFDLFAPRLINKKELPNQIMLNTHPQRWNDDFLRWGKELVWQNMKNQIKRFVSRR